MSQRIEDSLWLEFEEELKKHKDFDISKLELNLDDSENLDIFFKKFLDPKENFPSGERHSVIEKNFAIYILKNGIDIEEIKKAYQSKGFNVSSLISQIKGITKGTYGNNPSVNVGELVNWTKKYRPDLKDIFKTKSALQMRWDREEKILRKEFGEGEQRKDFQLIWEKDLENASNQEQEWLVKDLIPQKSVGVWTGKRGTFKTFFSLSLASSVSKGLEFLGDYECKKKKVLYLDKENGINIMRRRTDMIKRGLGLEEESLDIGFICFSQLKIDSAQDILSLNKIIQEYEIGLLVIDTYRRAISFDENNAGEVSRLFVDILRPLVEKHDLTIILIHHDRKGTAEGGDEMDMIRGSSDLANYSDFILKNDRKGSNLVLKQLKCRNAPEINPLSVTYDTDETSFFTFKSLGNYQKQGKDEKVAETLLIWINKNNLKSFKTGEAQDIAFSKGFKKTNFHNGLKLLESRGIINSEGFGLWGVIE